MKTLLLIIEILLLVAFSAACSGLNISLMSLVPADLKRKSKLGNRDAKRVLPFRLNSHLSLAAILFSNIGAVSASSLVLEKHINGLLAGLLSTLLIVTFGEVLPQAFFIHRALRLTSKLAPLLRIMIIVTFPVAKPLQLLLDRLFKDYGTPLQSRRELGLVISEHVDSAESELDDDEVEIIRGALQLSEKRVSDIMTPIRKVYKLLPTDIINGAKIDEIKEQGWSRIPIINQQLTTCYGVLLMKDLVDIDFDEQDIRIIDLPLYPVEIVGGRTALDTLLRKYIKNGTHLVPVERNDKIIGISTIEDLLEEIVGHEIEDETDRKKRVPSKSKKAN